MENYQRDTAEEFFFGRSAEDGSLSLIDKHTLLARVKLDPSSTKRLENKKNKEKKKKKREREELASKRESKEQREA